MRPDTIGPSIGAPAGVAAGASTEAASVGCAAKPSATSETPASARTAGRMACMMLPLSVMAPMLPAPVVSPQPVAGDCYVGMEPVLRYRDTPPHRVRYIARSRRIVAASRPS